jgi:hypothetical protein
LHQLYANIGTENAASTALLLNLIWKNRRKERLDPVNGVYKDEAISIDQY